MDKDKNIENIAEKLLKRLKDEIGMEEIINISYTLSVLNIRELSLRKIIECYFSFKERLDIPEVKDNFLSLVKRLKRQ